MSGLVASDDDYIKSIRSWHDRKKNNTN